MYNSIMKQNECQCGCGELVKPGNRYILGHSQRGKTPSIETRQRMSIGHADMRGEKNPFYGKQHTDETKNKIGFANSGVLVGDNNPNWIGGKPRRICEFCGKLFQSYNCQKTRFCSKKCEAAWQKTQLGEKNNAWKGGKSFEPYGLEFNNQLKELIRIRDNYKCQICNKPEIYEQGNLSTHHIDYDKNNSMPDNLISLCRKCHSKTNGNRSYWQKLFVARIQRSKIKIAN